MKFIVSALLGLGALSGCTSSRSTSPQTATVASGAASASLTSSLTSTSTSVQPSPRLDSAAGIAAELTNAERGIRDDSSSAAQIDAWGRRQQRAYHALADHPEWDDAVRALLALDAVAPFLLNVQARRAVVDHAATKPQSPLPGTFPAWKIVQPLSVATLLGFYREAQAATGVPWQYLAAINVVETRTGRIVGVSSSGAVGPMQFLPTTWASCCTGDVLDPHDAIMGAAVYLVARGAPGDMRRALFGYNPNSGYVDAVDAYARNMIADERAFNGYHAWEVYAGSTAGTVRLPVGYAPAQPENAAAYVVAHPENVVPLSD